MVESDDDMPPPLEDMTEKIEVVSEARKKMAGQGFKHQDDDVEETRLGGNKPKTSSIPMSPADSQNI